MTKPLPKNLKPEDAKQLVKQEKPLKKEELKKTHQVKKATAAKGTNNNKTGSKRKNPIKKVCIVCGEDFTTYYKTGKICSKKCISEYNSLNSWRPQADIEVIKEGIWPFLQIGCSLEESVLESKVCHYHTVLKYRKINKSFSTWIEAMSNYSVVKAKKTIYKHVSEHNLKAAMWLLTKKRPKEYWNQIDITTGGNAFAFTMDLPPSQFGKVALEAKEKEDENED